MCVCSVLGCLPTLHCVYTYLGYLSSCSVCMRRPGTLPNSPGVSALTWYVSLVPRCVNSEIVCPTIYSNVAYNASLFFSLTWIDPFNPSCVCHNQ